MGTKTETNPLKYFPCPFCGSTDIEYDNDTGQDDDSFWFWIGCNNCGAKANDEKAWNRRAPTPSKQDAHAIVSDLRSYADSANGPYAEVSVDDLREWAERLSGKQDAQGAVAFAFIENIIELWGRKEPVENFLNAIPKMIAAWRVLHPRAPAASTKEAEGES